MPLDVSRVSRMPPDADVFQATRTLVLDLGTEDGIIELTHM
jgi:hypothetical protein